MKLLLALMVWSHGVCLASSAAADEKAASSESIDATVVRPEIPKDIAILYERGLRPGDVPIVSKEVTEWVMKDPNNINGVHTYRAGRSQVSLLMRIIETYGGYPETGDILRAMLGLKPDVRYKARAVYGQPTDALQAIFDDVSDERPDHMEFVQKIIDLLLEQGENPAEIANHLKSIRRSYGMSETDKRGLSAERIHEYGYGERMINAALEYLHDLQAAPILEKELTEHLGIPELSRIGGEYIAPLKKKGGKASSAGKSGGGK